MRATIDSGGRVLLPKALRDSLGLTPGSQVDISAYGSGVQVSPAGRTATVVERNGRLIAISEDTVTDEMLYSIMDSGRR